MEKFKTVAFIPARGGSKRIPRKNIKMLAGKPMLAWTIEASLKSKYINRTFVSTEDREIKEIALQYGAEVIDRPAKYSKGQIDINFAYYDFRYYLWKERYHPDYMVFLLPTMPLRTAKHIDEAFELMIKSGSLSIYSVAKAHRMPFNTYFIDKSGRLKCFIKKRNWVFVDTILGKTQDTGRVDFVYNLTSVIDIGLYDSINYSNPSYYESGLPYIMSAEDSTDVDTPLDFRVAEMLLEDRIKKGEK